MSLSGIIWIIMQHSSWSTFTLDVFLTEINLIYPNLSNHQPFDGLSITIITVKLFAEKRNLSLDNIVTVKIKIVI